MISRSDVAVPFPNHRRFSCPLSRCLSGQHDGVSSRTLLFYRVERQCLFLRLRTPCSSSSGSSHMCALPLYGSVDPLSPPFSFPPTLFPLTAPSFSSSLFHSLSLYLSSLLFASFLLAFLYFRLLLSCSPHNFGHSLLSLFFQHPLSFLHLSLARLSLPFCPSSYFTFSSRPRAPRGSPYLSSRVTAFLFCVYNLFYFSSILLLRETFVPLFHPSSLCSLSSAFSPCCSRALSPSISFIPSLYSFPIRHII